MYVTLILYSDKAQDSQTKVQTGLPSGFHPQLLLWRALQCGRCEASWSLPGCYWWPGRVSSGCWTPLQPSQGKWHARDGQACCLYILWKLTVYERYGRLHFLQLQRLQSRGHETSPLFCKLNKSIMQVDRWSSEWFWYISALSWRSSKIHRGW